MILDARKALNDFASHFTDQDDPADVTYTLFFNDGPTDPRNLGAAVARLIEETSAGWYHFHLEIWGDANFAIELTGVIIDAFNKFAYAVNKPGGFGGDANHWTGRLGGELPDGDGVNAPYRAWIFWMRPYADGDYWIDASNITPGKTTLWGRIVNAEKKTKKEIVRFFKWLFGPWIPSVTFESNKRAIGDIQNVLDQLWTGEFESERQIIEELHSVIIELGGSWTPPPTTRENQSEFHND